MSKDIYRELLEEIRILKIERFYDRRRMDWLYKKLGKKCPHPHLEYLDTNQIACEDCGRVWDRWNVLSE